MKEFKQAPFKQLDVFKKIVPLRLKVAWPQVKIFLQIFRLMKFVKFGLIYTCFSK